MSNSKTSKLLTVVAVVAVLSWGSLAMAQSASYNTSTDVLTVQGSSGDDCIYVSKLLGYIWVLIEDPSGNQQYSGIFNYASSVKTIYTRGNAGDDDIDMSYINVGDFPSLSTLFMEGQAGDDYCYGSPLAFDTFWGGADDDWWDAAVESGTQ